MTRKRVKKSRRADKDRIEWQDNPGFEVGFRGKCFLISVKKMRSNQIIACFYRTSLVISYDKVQDGSYLHTLRSSGD